jgi:hypothetical protein
MSDWFNTGGVSAGERQPSLTAVFAPAEEQPEPTMDHPPADRDLSAPIFNSASEGSR